MMAAINRAVHGHRAEHFKYDVLLTKYSLSEGTMLVPQILLLTNGKRYNSHVAMIVGTFDENGQALLYVIKYPYYGGGWVDLASFPGYSCIGAGDVNANFWLNYRKQNLGLSIRQSIYHTYERVEWLQKRRP